MEKEIGERQGNIRVALSPPGAHGGGGNLGGIDDGHEDMELLATPG